MNLDHAEYKRQCERRWSGECLRDARNNWAGFEELQDDLVEALRRFKRNPFLQDQSGKCHNPDGTLTAFLWQASWEPDRSCLAPLLDFCDHYQKVFLRRGLLIYCTLILKELEKPADVQEGQLLLTVG